MMTVIPTPRFKQALANLDSKKLSQARKAVKKFIANPFLPGLNFEQLGGTDSYTIRVNKGFRICMRKVAPRTFDLVDVGTHDYIYKNYG
jgi:mRNA-degrading endonuclease RelE of RelBE toxin-antitoxin system